MNEIVKYHNDLNMLSMGGLSEIQVNILFTIFAKIRNKEGEVIKLNLEDIIELAGLSKTNPKYINEYIFPIFKKIQFLQFRYFETEYREAQEVIFPRVVIDRKSQEFEIKISKEFVYLFNNLVSNFTRFELAEFVNLQSRYAKTLYRLLKQYRRTGELRISWERFIDVMGIPNTYRMFDIERQILKPITKELQREQHLFDQKRQPFKNLKFEKCKTKGKGNKITHIKFTFTPQKTIFDEFLDKSIIVPQISPEPQRIINAIEHPGHKDKVLLKLENSNTDVVITYEQLKKNIQ